MTIRSMNSKIIATALSCALALPALLVGSGLLAPSVAEAAVTKAACRVHAVEALEEGDGTIPAELAFMADQLEAPEFGRYRSYNLIGVKSFELELDREIEQKFKSGHSVKLTLLGGEKGKLELDTKLLRGSTTLVDLQFAVGSQLVLIPVRRGDSMVIFAYQCKK